MPFSEIILINVNFIKAVNVSAVVMLNRVNEPVCKTKPGSTI